MALADCVVIPTRVGGVETARAEAVLDMVPRKTPAGLVISSARTYTRDYQDAIAALEGGGGPGVGNRSRSGSASRPDPTAGSRPTASTASAASGAAPCGPSAPGPGAPRRTATSPGASARTLIEGDRVHERVRVPVHEVPHAVLRRNTSVARSDQSCGG